MKRRTGFISNSSSSSFIIGIGVIKDEERLRKELEAQGCSDYEIKTVSEIKENSDWEHKYWVDTQEVVNIACVNDEPYISLKVTGEDTKIFLINVGNNEGDNSFWNGDDMDYKQVDYDWFSKSQQFLMDVLEDKEIISSSSGYEYGASRNG